MKDMFLGDDLGFDRVVFARRRSLRVAGNAVALVRPGAQIEQFAAL